MYNKHKVIAHNIEHIYNKTNICPLINKQIVTITETNSNSKLKSIKMNWTQIKKEK